MLRRGIKDILHIMSSQVHVSKILKLSNQTYWAVDGVEEKERFASREVSTEVVFLNSEKILC